MSMDCHLVYKVTKDVELAKLMLMEQGFDLGSILVGASVHNQRIDRLWRDVFKAVSQLYYRPFYHMESTGLLYPSTLFIFMLCILYFYHA